MAYVDKITYLRRMALIQPKHNIMLEGVDIEGVCVLKSVIDGSILTLNQTELREFISRTGLELKYQDPVSKEAWEPRLEGSYNV